MKPQLRFIEYLPYVSGTVLNVLPKLTDTRHNTLKQVPLLTPFYRHRRLKLREVKSLAPKWKAGFKSKDV